MKDKKKIKQKSTKGLNILKIKNKHGKILFCFAFSFCFVFNFV